MGLLVECGTSAGDEERDVQSSRAVAKILRARRDAAAQRLHIQRLCHAKGDKIHAVRHGRISQQNQVCN